MALDVSLSLGQTMSATCQFVMALGKTLGQTRLNNCVSNPAIDVNNLIGLFQTTQNYHLPVGAQTLVPLSPWLLTCSAGATCS